jgi:hypothetical protein
VLQAFRLIPMAESGYFSKYLTKMKETPRKIYENCVDQKENNTLGSKHQSIIIEQIVRIENLH